MDYRYFYVHTIEFFFTQDVFVEGTGEIDINQLPVIQSQTQDLAGKSEVVQVVWVNKGLSC